MHSVGITSPYSHAQADTLKTPTEECKIKGRVYQSKLPFFIDLTFIRKRENTLKTARAKEK